MRGVFLFRETLFRIIQYRVIQDWIFPFRFFLFRRNRFRLLQNGIFNRCKLSFIVSDALSDNISMLFKLLDCAAYAVYSVFANSG